MNAPVRRGRVSAFALLAASLVPVLSAADAPPGGPQAPGAAAPARKPDEIPPPASAAPDDLRTPRPAPAEPTAPRGLVGRMADAEAERPVLDSDAAAVSTRAGASDWGTMLPFLGWTAVLLLLLAGAVALVRRFLPAARRRFGADAMRLLVRRTLSPQHTLYLVEVGPRLLVLGATKTGLAPLAEFCTPEEVAHLKSLCPGGADDGSTGAFQDSLRASLRQYERPGAGDAEAAGLRQAMTEIEEIKRMIASWK